MIQLLRTDSDNPDFALLVRLLDADLAHRDGADHTFYAQFNKTDKLKHTIIATVDGLPVACGAMRPLDTGTMEIKRMYTLPGNRGKGIAAAVLGELEKWAGEMGYETCVLETGKRQPEAIRLYKASGYTITANYGQYAGVENSVCFSKELRNPE